MYRLRFESFEQIFDIPQDVEIILPLAEICSHKSCEFKNRIIAEIPAVIWEHKVETIKNDILKASEMGISDFICENIGAIELCRELGVKAHGGAYLNVLNRVSADSYFKMGLENVTLSFEMPFTKMRKLPADRSLMGAVIYGYLPLMKFRACPAMGASGCGNCTKENYLKDRKNEQFRIICRGGEYSELLNCVPLYAADKSLPELGFYTLYFTVEDRTECEKIFKMVCGREAPDFRRTSGLYNRELL